MSYYRPPSGHTSPKVFAVSFSRKGACLEVEEEGAKMNILIVLLAFVATAEGCSCQRRMITREYFCNFDFVSRASVKWKSAVGSEQLGYILYGVKHLKVFWNRLSNVTLPRTIGTPAKESFCGVSLEERVYLLAGRIDTHGRATVTLCDIAKPWTKVKPRDRRMLKGLKCSKTD
ncbi:hypothetical protein Y032_0009g562 [Ancylostoma ceylanicum]|uniref:NTR domain-containing protein n=1 Tax=Ancylostoma ceylanicum TaxID=53326 RepID=A0A016VIS2_9BILA|nr:hypothetical protein Y032_0009g562 [Ancylostoma ceylanicum]